MIKQKLKICAGFDGNEHEAYIYKNIGGKKYCKSCTYKLEPQKPIFKIHVIPKISEKQRIKNRQKKDLLVLDKEFYLECWRDKFMYLEKEAGFPGYHTEPRCQVCMKSLGFEPNLTYFHHILEKRNFPAFRHVKKNIAIICSDCHNRYETMPDKVPKLVEKKKELLLEIIKTKP